MAISKVSTLQGLFLDNCVQLLDSDLLPLQEANGPNFRELSLVGLTSVTDASICAIVKRSGAGLISLRLGGCVLLSDAVLVQIRAVCKDLRRLDLGHNDNISEAALLSLFIKVNESAPASNAINMNCEASHEDERRAKRRSSHMIHPRWRSVLTVTSDLWRI